MNFDIKNKTAVITGANRGIGLAITKSFLQHGAKKVYLAVRNPDSVQGLLDTYGERVAAIQVDVGNQDSIKSLAAQTQDADVVINNAGILKVADPLATHAEATFREELKVNTFGLLRMAQAYAPILETKDEAAFVQLNSVASIKNFNAFTTYSASKAASYSITQGLRESWAEQGIQVLSVHPGPIATDMADEAGMGDMAEPVEVVAEGIVEALATGQFHLFPDTMAKQFGSAFHDYAMHVIEASPE